MAPPKGKAGAAAATAKGELGEIQKQLQALAQRPAADKGAASAKRELLKRIVSYLTVGIDMSPLFSDCVILNAGTPDVATKKLLYHYITHYAETNPELALLTVNTLQKDTQADDPTVRGLAIRSLASLRVPSLVEYLVESVQSGLKDSHPYPRKTATMGVLKVWAIDAESVEGSGMLDTVREMLVNERDAVVVANCLAVLREVDGFASLTSKAIVYSLINRIKDFTEWTQCLVLELTAHYTPASPDETFDLLNALEDRLTHSNGAVVLATVRVFLQVTLPMPDTHQQVYDRIKNPLLTLATTAASSELAYGIWAHMQLLVARAPMLFSTDYKSFFIRDSDLAAVKSLKLEALTAVADSQNAYDIATELSEYVADVDVHVARQAVQSVARIALMCPDAAGIVDRLLQFLDMGMDYVQAEVLVTVKDVLRRYPERANDCIVSLGSIDVSCVQDPHARCALIWILGEYGQALPEAPYQLEPLLTAFEEEESPNVRLSLLTAALKLFFKRAPEMQRMLGKALAAGCADSDQDVHDRALMYYRLLQHSPEQAAAVVNCEKETISTFSDHQRAAETVDRVFDEFNTLAVLYRKPSSAFLEAGSGDTANGDGVGRGANGAAAAEQEDQPAASMADENLLEGGDADAVADLLQLDDPSPPAGAAPPGVGPSTSAPPGDLLADLLSAPPAAAPPPQPPLQLQPAPQLDPATFQAKWGALPVAAALDETLQPMAAQALMANSQGLLRHFAAAGVGTMASGGAPPQLKYFFFARPAPPAGDGVYLVEMNVDLSARRARVNVKADAPNAPTFAQTLRGALASFAG